MILFEFIDVDRLKHSFKKCGMSEVLKDCHDTCTDFETFERQHEITNLYLPYKEQSEGELTEERVIRCINDMFEVLPNELKSHFCNRCFPSSEI